MFTVRVGASETEDSVTYSHLRPHSHQNSSRPYLSGYLIHPSYGSVLFCTTLHNHSTTAQHSPSALPFFLRQFLVKVLAHPSLTHIMNLSYIPFLVNSFLRCWFTFFPTFTASALLERHSTRLRRTVADQIHVKGVPLG